MKKLLCSMALTLVASTSFAQNMAIYKADVKIQESKIGEALQIIEPALTDPRTTKLAEAYNMAAGLHLRLFTPELMKLAQQEACDTTAFIEHLDKAVEYYTKSDQYDMAPDKKGKVKPKFHTDNRQRLMTMLPYYNYAAILMNASHKPKESMKYFQKYVDMAKNPAFTKAEQDSIFASNKKAYNQTSYNLTLLSYEMKDWDGVIRNSEAALKDTANLHDLYIVRGQAFLAKQDTANWITTYKEAIERLDDSEGFFQNLLSYYLTKNKIDDAIALADQMIKEKPESAKTWYMKGTIELNVKKDYAAARESFQKAIALQPNYYEANLNIGVAYINEVVKMRNDHKFCLDKTKVKQYYADMERMRDFYKKALPYFEEARELGKTSEQAKFWANNLENVYANLGMKKMQDVMNKVILEANTGVYNADNYTWTKTRPQDIPAAKHEVLTKTVYGKARR